VCLQEVAQPPPESWKEGRGRGSGNILQGILCDGCLSAFSVINWQWLPMKEIGGAPRTPWDKSVWWGLGRRRLVFGE